MKFSAIVRHLEEQFGPDRLTCDLQADPEITTVAPIETAPTGTLSYIEGGKFASWVTKTTASALVLPAAPQIQAQASERQIAWIAAREPRLLFARAIALFYQPFRPEPGIHPTASIDPTAKLGSNVSIGAGVVIYAEAEIGDGACLLANAIVYPQARIGARTILHANVIVAERSQIGPDCIIHSGAVIGSEGFGFVPTASGWVKMEQSGYVILEAGVEVGCNSTVDRPAVGLTRIGANTKIDNLVQIGHGCTIGKNCALAAQVGLAGGVTVGDGVLLGGQVGVANQLHIGDGAIAMAQSGIARDVRPGEVVGGTPAIQRTHQLRAHSVYQRLPEIYRWLQKFQNAGNP
ncbi:MAG: UDP-3-O-(3-hydroxymyristoyl)glucosamine N-acyltransferase [Cyanobacteria bacterium J06641_5]